MVKNYDVIVIGAGNGGLTAAARSAHMGMKTLLLEKHNIPGGCASSFRRGRFEFETALHELAEYGGPEDRGEIRRLFDKLGLELEMIEMKHAFRTIVTGPDGFDAAVPMGMEAFIQKMEVLSPGSEKSVRQCFALADDCSNALRYIFKNKGVYDRDVLLRDHSNFMKVANTPVTEVFEALRMPTAARNILSTYWSYIGLPLTKFDFMLYILMVKRYIEIHAYIPKMRSHDITLALADAVYRFGGDVWYNTEVKRILVKDRRAYGVVTANGEEVHARHIISNISHKTVFANMIDREQIPAQDLNLARARSVGLSSFDFYMGMSKSPEELGIEDYCIFFADTVDTDDLYDRFSDIERNGRFTMNCMNIANPGCSPEGTSLMWCTMLFKGEAWNAVKPENYNKTKRNLVMRVIKEYERLTGNILSDSIEEIAIAAPPTFARYIGTPNGSIYGYEPFLWDGMMPRMLAAGEENNIQGLHFCGGHGERLHGFSSAYSNGDSAARIVAAEMKEGR